jgi:hypothetical protein
MPKRLVLICLMPALLIGCMQSRDADVTASALTQSSSALTQAIQSRAPENTEGGPPSPGIASWFVNADRTIWMLDQERVAGQRTKTAWFRPARTRLEVTGRRLDAPAPPLVVETSPSGEEYRHMFQPSIMIFPTEGRWEITAKAGASEARFVVEVKMTD